MRPTPRALALALSTLLAAPAAAEDDAKYTLRYKLATGDVLRYEIVHNASIRSSMDGTTQRVETRSESVKAWKVIDVLPSGEIEVQNVVESVKMTNRLPDRAEQTYDSEADKAPPPGFEDAAKAVGVPLSEVRMTPWGEVIRREVKHHQPAADPHAPVCVLLPEAPVAVGEAWNDPVEIKVKLPEGSSREVKTRRHFRLVDVQHGVATIEAEHQVLSPVTPPVEAQLAQRLMTGKVRFDIEEGRILSQEFEVDKRVLGFAGPTSSMHYVMRMTERLRQKPESIASRP